jgi:hypothetical protein
MASQPVRRPVSGLETPCALYGSHLGQITELTEHGRPFVQFNGAVKPIMARVGLPSGAVSASEACVGTRVVLIFEDGDPTLPVIVGLVRDSFAAPEQSLKRADISARSAESVELSLRKVVLEAKEEIVLRCGAGSLTIRADGQVIIKGTRLMSKASETNKVRGASVLIN